MGDRSRGPSRDGGTPDLEAGESGALNFRVDAQGRIPYVSGPLERGV